MHLNEIKCLELFPFLLEVLYIVLDVVLEVHL